MLDNNLAVNYGAHNVDSRQLTFNLLNVDAQKSTRKATDTDGSNLLLTIGTTKSTDNGAVATERHLVRLDKTIFSDDLGQNITASAYAVIVHPAAGITAVNMDELVGGLVSVLVNSSSWVSADNAPYGTTIVNSGTRIQKILNGEP
jgi:hypothetical protein